MLKKNKIDDYLWFAHCLGRDRVTTFTYMRFFFKKGCKVVKTPMYKGFATSERLSEVVKRLSDSWQCLRTQRHFGLF